LIHDTLLCTNICVMADCTDTESGELGGASGEGGKRWGSVSNIGDNEVLDVGR
jgi:hypothetical protein